MESGIHALQNGPADWAEKNCYADLWVGFLGALGLEPLAMLGHTVAVDFEGDQWTFFKPPHAELRELYGVDVQEMTVWRTMEQHAIDHLAAGRFICTEADAFWLPDTAATDYRRKHTKTTILIHAIDAGSRTLRYFHNAGYYTLEGEDYERLLRADATADPAFMPLFAELVHVERCVRRSPADLCQRALRLLRVHHEWRPVSNPFQRFGEGLARDLPELQQAGLEHYHAWAFATIRQAGSAFELAAAHARWLAQSGVAAFAAAAEHFAAISAANKSLILKGARSVATRKPFDARDAVSTMVHAWNEGMQRLGDALECGAR